MGKKSIGCGGTILVLIFAGIVFSQIGKCQSEVAERKVQQSKAKHKQELQAKLKVQFSQERERIIQNIQKLVDEKQYAKAKNVSQQYLFLHDPEVQALHNRASEEVLYTEVKRIPAKEWEKNRDGYAKLMKLNPEKELYQKKFKHYDSKIRQREKVHRNRVARFGDLPRRDELFGGYYEVKKYLKSVAHDPGSIKFDTCTKIFHTKDGWLVGCDYRGKNAFGAYVRNFNWFTIRYGQVIKVDEVGAYSLK